ncbi:unnamed protein product, partial [Schistosoma curassoni]|uniref:Uncharacterized protein n=1 Tax=Schistosoma curassoni TaxID=6186 RepID=A0A183JIE1_9TREM
MILLKFYYYITLLQLNYINGQLNECDNLQENRTISHINYDTNELNPIDNNNPLEMDIVNIKEMEWNDQKSITRSWPLDVINNDECHQMNINSNVNNPCQELKQNQEENEKDVKCNEESYNRMNKIRSNQNKIMMNKEKSNRIYGNQFDELSQTQCNQLENEKTYDVEKLNWKVRNEEYSKNDEENTMIKHENILETKEKTTEQEKKNKNNGIEIEIDKANQQSEQKMRKNTTSKNKNQQNVIIVNKNETRNEKKQHTEQQTKLHEGSDVT